MRIGVIAAGSLLLVGSAVAAQTSLPQVREGFTASFGFGAGSGGVSCTNCSTTRETGVSGYLRLGSAVRPGLIVAGETNGFVKSIDGGQVNFSFYSAALQWYPQPASGFYLKGNAGFATSQFVVEDFGFGTLELESNGFAAGVGAGYDLRVGRMFSLTPYVNLMTSVRSEARFLGQSLGEKLNPNLLQFGIGFTWH